MATLFGTTVTSTVGGRLYITAVNGTACGGGKAVKDVGLVPAGTYIINFSYGAYCGSRVVVNGNYYFSDGIVETTASLTLIEIAPELPFPLPLSPHDCINGSCIPQLQYSTPGQYPNLTACQSGCASNSNCVGECVSPQQLAALQAAADILKTKFCK
jgi:hypothetical protein